MPDPFTERYATSELLDTTLRGLMPWYHLPNLPLEWLLEERTLLSADWLNSDDIYFSLLEEAEKLTLVGTTSSMSLSRQVIEMLKSP